MIERIIEISPWIPYERLPADIAQLMSNQETQAYQGLSQYFKGAATRSGESSLIELFDELESEDTPTVSIVREGDEAWMTWFQFPFSCRKLDPGFRPRSSISVPGWFPKRIKTLYDEFGGIRTSNRGRFGLLPPEQFLSDDKFRIESTHVSHDPGSAIFFFGFGNGDFMGYSRSGAEVFYNHERASLENTEIDGVTNAFLKSLLRSAFD